MDEPTLQNTMPELPPSNKAGVEPAPNARAAKASRQRPVRWALVIALATGTLAFLTWYTDVRQKAPVLLCDIARIAGRQAHKLSFCSPVETPTEKGIRELTAKINTLENLGPLPPKSKAKLKTLKELLAQHLFEKVLIQADNAGFNIDSEAENTGAEAVREVVVEGDSEERQALGLIAEGQTQSGLNKLRELANQAEEENVQRWRRIAEISYLVDTRHATFAYEKLQALGAMTTWDSIYLGRLYQRGGSLPKALTVFQTALAQLPANQRRSISVLHNEIGDILKAQGDGPAALQSYRSAMTIRQQLADSDPSNSQWQRDLSVSHIKIGDALARQGRIAEALAAYQTSLPIAKSLALRFPEHRQFQNDIKIIRRRLQTLQAQDKE